MLSLCGPRELRLSVSLSGEVRNSAKTILSIDGPSVAGHLLITLCEGEAADAMLLVLAIT